MKALVGCSIAECDENGILVDLLRDFRPETKGAQSAGARGVLSVGRVHETVFAGNPLSLHKTIKHAMCARRKRVSLLFCFALQTDRRREEAPLPSVAFVELSSKSALPFDRSRAKKLASLPGWLRKLECLYEAPVAKALLSALAPSPQVGSADAETACTFILNLAAEDEQTESYLRFSQLLLEKAADLEQLARSLRLMVSKKKSSKSLLGGGEELRRALR